MSKQIIKNLKSCLLSKYFFLHLPKTGGTALCRNITSAGEEKSFRFGKHNDSVRNIRNFPFKKKVLITIRDPITWYTSIYNQKILTSLSNIDNGKDYPIMPDNSFEDFVADVIMRDNGFEQYARWFKPLRLHHKEIFRILPETGFLTALLMWYTCDNRYYNQSQSMSINSLKKSLEKVHSIRMERMEIDFNHHVPELANSVNLNKIHNKLNFDIIPSRTHPNYRSNHLDYYSPKLIDLVKKLDRFFYDQFGYP